MRTGLPPGPPPELADALLHQWLPKGVLGLSILGDLHQEYEELIDAGGRAPRLCYWRSALALSARYALVRLKKRALETDSEARRQEGKR